MNKKVIGITTTVCLLGGLLFTFTHCGMPASQKLTSKYSDDVSYPVEANHNGTENDAPIPETEEGKLVEQTVDLGLKGFEQILVTMSSITGVDQNNNSIQSLYRNISAQLPTDNSIKSFTASTQVAILKLASEYCNTATRSTTLRSNLWPSTNFGQRPADAYNSQRREVFIAESLESFLPQYEENDVEFLEYGQEMEALIVDLMNTSENTTTATRNIAFGICTTLLSSLEVSSL